MITGAGIVRHDRIAAGTPGVGGRKSIRETGDLAFCGDRRPILVPAEPAGIYFRVRGRKRKGFKDRRGAAR
jgi:hypothetical protein